MDATVGRMGRAGIPARGWLLLGFLGILLGLAFLDGIRPMVLAWMGSEEYGYGFLIPLIVAYMVWQKKDHLARTGLQGSWWGVAVLLLGMALALLGRLSALDTLIQYALLWVIAGLVLAYTGPLAFRQIWVPLLMLALMVPLPGSLQQGLSGELQLISSRLGAEVMRAAGVSVFLEGNVIDLGSQQLEVAEACNGLRYLFPLLAMGCIAAYFFQARLWKRLLVFLSALPITVLMNSLRIGMIGISVEYGGPSLTAGLLHDMEGWLMFMASLGLLLLEMWVLARLGRDGRPLNQVFGITLPARNSAKARILLGPLPPPFLGAVILMTLYTLATLALPKWEPTKPTREAFATFPQQLGHWQGKVERLDRLYVDALNFDDYLMADYLDREGHRINLYAGYYASQRSDKAPHSPQACMPGQGWEVADHSRRILAVPGRHGPPLEVNRILIRKGEMRQLVYYWYPQRGRVISSEFWLKWFIFWDGLVRNRNDGALLRLTTPLSPNQDPDAADRWLTDFVQAAVPRLGPYLPD